MVRERWVRWQQMDSWNRKAAHPGALVVPGADDAGLGKSTPVLVPLPRINPFAMNLQKSWSYIDADCIAYLDAADANLGWQHPGDGETARGYVRSNEKGEALIPIAKSGLMTIRLKHMTRPKTKDYEWESFWSTLLTFRVP